MKIKYHHYTPLESIVSCQQSVDHRVVTSLNCRELHAFEPLRVARSHRLVRTLTAQRIALVNEQLYSSSYGSAARNSGFQQFSMDLLE
ncbi:hypothetical protein LSTR_LSTR014455 [Laodelphax striatellus]|uniref:Uncharacterized protein n=1 Tax=Laodelphax striatellus TaxID=195883 RepID=A0A482XD83_LAOST|nr:hypothetical protein LSTR_LSTR014455 [Laodelphax striatellus]